MDIKDAIKKREKLNSRQFWVFNPLESEFVFKWDGKEYSIPAMSKKSFPFYLREHAINLLVDYLVAKNEKGYITQGIRKKYRMEVEL